MHQEKDANTAGRLGREIRRSQFSRLPAAASRKMHFGALEAGGWGKRQTKSEQGSTFNTQKVDYCSTRYTLYSTRFSFGGEMFLPRCARLYPTILVFVHKNENGTV